MITIKEARRIVAKHLPLPRSLSVELDEAAGRVLAQNIVADHDNPPFNRSAMDGYAVRARDVASPPATLAIIEDIAAGYVPTQAVTTDECAKIMTGAPLPEGADAVVMVERTEPAGDGMVRIFKSVARGENVCPRGENFGKGDTLLRVGTPIRTAEVALMATVGVVGVSVFAPPAVAILSTGAELISAKESPGAGQIRDCNSYALAARLAMEGIHAERLGIVADEREPLTEAIGRGLERDVLILSGGVSMGDYDFVPAVLRELGVDLLFEKIAMKPGKPTVFGKRGSTLVFALPGNPVSTQAAAELLVIPALRRMMGHANAGPRAVRAELTAPLKHKGDRRSHLPVILTRKDEGYLAAPVPYHGSGDTKGVALGNALAILKAGEKLFDAGRMINVVLLDAKEPW